MLHKQGKDENGSSLKCNAKESANMQIKYDPI